MSEEQTNPTDKLSAALVKAQSSISCVSKDRKVDAGRFQYSYITLAAVIEHVRKPLTDNGLWFVQLLEADDAGKYRLVTRLTHSSGQFIEGRTPLMVESSDNQKFGSALSYMRRYSLIAMLGVAPDEDDDANSADGKDVKTLPSAQRKPLNPPAKKAAEPTKPAGVESEMSEIIKGVPDANGANWCVRNMKRKSWADDVKKRLWLELVRRGVEVGVTWDSTTGTFV